MTPDNVIPFPQRPESERTAENAAKDRWLMDMVFGPHLPEGKEDFFENQDDDNGPEAA